MSLFRDKIQRAIESTSNDVTPWHQQPLTLVAQAVEDKLLPEIQLINSDANGELLAEHEKLKSELETVKAELTTAQAELSEGQCFPYGSFFRTYR